jgi:SAM-dependent methyltransferase
MRWGAPADFPAIYEQLNVPAFFAAFSDELLDRARLDDGERILDVATGTGVVLRRARERYPGRARAVGLDITPGMLAVARDKAQGLDIEFVEGDAADLPFEDGAFDVVTCQQGLQFFPERDRALREFRRVLAPGGRAVVACWSELETGPVTRRSPRPSASACPSRSRWRGRRSPSAAPMRCATCSHAQASTGSRSSAWTAPRGTRRPRTSRVGSWKARRWRSRWPRCRRRSVRR